MSIVLVTGALAPYTTRLYDAFVSRHGVKLTVLVCESVEPQRQWVLAKPQYFNVERLAGYRRHVNYTRHIYVNPGVISALRRLTPAKLLVEDFSPTMALATLYARARGLPYGIKTDGHRGIDPGETSRIHAAMRRLMVPPARFAVCASEDSRDFLEHWGLTPGRGHIVPIVTPWDAPACVARYDERPFDVLFAGALNEETKGALFFADVLGALAARLGRRLRVRVVGDGPLRQELAARLAACGCDTQFDGFLQADRMADVFASAKMLMFPSRGDAWGLVANEAAICGTPVLGSTAAISSKRLVEAYGIGLMRPLQVGPWVDAAEAIIGTREMWQVFAGNRDRVVAAFSLERSVAALAAAFGLTPSHEGPPSIHASAADR